MWYEPPIFSGFNAKTGGRRCGTPLAYVQVGDTSPRINDRGDGDISVEPLFAIPQTKAAIGASRLTCELHGSLGWGSLSYRRTSRAIP